MSEWRAPDTSASLQVSLNTSTSFQESRDLSAS
jgi:hypothetical protein